MKIIALLLIAALTFASPPGTPNSQKDEVLKYRAKEFKRRFCKITDLGRVAESARLTRFVSVDSADIGENAKLDNYVQVFKNAKIADEVSVGERSRILIGALIQHSAIIYPGSVVTGTVKKGNIIIPTPSSEYLYQTSCPKNKLNWTRVYYEKNMKSSDLDFNQELNKLLKAEISEINTKTDPKLLNAEKDPGPIRFERLREAKTLYLMRYHGEEIFDFNRERSIYRLDFCFPHGFPHIGDVKVDNNEVLLKQVRHFGKYKTLHKSGKPVIDEENTHSFILLLACEHEQRRNDIQRSSGTFESICRDIVNNKRQVACDDFAATLHPKAA